MRRILITVIVSMATIALLPAQQPPAGFNAAMTPVTGAPYSAVAVTETSHAGNGAAQSRSQKVYRDSQGRQRSEGAAVAPDGTVSAVISDPVAKVGYTLNGRDRTAVQTSLMSLSGSQAVGVGAPPGVLMRTTLNNTEFVISGAMIAAPLGANAVKEDLGTQTIEGVLATGTRSTLTIPAGQVGNPQAITLVDETWYSPELQMNVLTRHSDPRTGGNVYRLTQIERSEPDPKLFQVPPDYKLTK